MTAPIGPATRPIATIVAPWPIRSSRGRARDADPIADQHDPGRAGGRHEPGDRADRAHDRGRLVGAAEGLGQADREQALEGDHREAPEQLHADERRAAPASVRSSPRPSPMTLRDGPDRGRHGRDTAGLPMLVHEDQDRDQVDDAERRARRGSAGPASGWRRTDRAPRGRRRASAPRAIATLSTVAPALRPCSIPASGSAARVVSTYQASSGPLSSAR